MKYKILNYKFIYLKFMVILNFIFELKIMNYIIDIFFKFI